MKSRQLALLSYWDQKQKYRILRLNYIAIYILSTPEGEHHETAEGRLAYSTGFLPEYDGGRLLLFQSGMLKNVIFAELCK